jgi:autophagy-related protein 9
MSLSANLSIWLLALGLLYWFVPKIFQIRRLKTMHDFYLHLLNIPDSDMQTISWQEVVARLMALRDVHPLTAERTSPQLLHYMDIRSQSKQRMDAHDIANRVMRKDNYMIALVNKDILNLKLPIPFLRNRELFTKATEMSIYSCILDQVFTPSGQIKEDVLKETKRKELSNLLRRRFMRAGIVNAIAAPAIVMYLLITWFLKNFNVSSLSQRLLCVASNVVARNIARIPPH